MNRESITRIEMTDEEWIAARTHKHIPRLITCYDTPSIPEIQKEEIDEPEKSKNTPKKPKKIHRKPNKTAMAKGQKKS